MSFFNFDMCCGVTRNDEERTTKSPRLGSDGTRWVTDHSSSPFLSSSDERGEDASMEVRVIRAKRLRSGYTHVHFNKPCCRVTLSDGRTDGRELGRTQVSVRETSEDADTWNWSSIVPMNRMDLLRPTTILRFEITDIEESDMYCIREFSGLDLRDLVNKKGTMKKALKLPGGGSIPKRAGKAPSLHVGVTITPNPYRNPHLSNVVVSPFPKSPSELKRNMSRRREKGDGGSGSGGTSSQRKNNYGTSTSMTKTTSSTKTTTDTTNVTSNAAQNIQKNIPIPFKGVVRQSFGSGSSSSVTNQSASDPQSFTTQGFISASTTSNGEVDAPKSPRSQRRYSMSHKISEHKTNSPIKVLGTVSSENIPHLTLLPPSPSPSPPPPPPPPPPGVSENSNIFFHIVLTQDDIEGTRTFEMCVAHAHVGHMTVKEIKHNFAEQVGTDPTLIELSIDGHPAMDKFTGADFGLSDSTIFEAHIKSAASFMEEKIRPPESPNRSLQSLSYKKIHSVLSTHAVPRDIDQALRTFSGSDRKGKVQITFFVSACKQAVAPDAAQMFFKKQELTDSFSRFFNLAMKYFDRCLQDVTQNQRTTHFTEIEDYDKFIIIIRACQLMLFKNEKERSSKQDSVMKKVRTNLKTFHEVLRIYVLMISRRVQIAVWEQQYGFGAVLLRRLWLDIGIVRAAMVEHHEGRGDINFSTVDELEQFLEVTALVCGRAAPENRKQLKVFMPDYHTTKHEKIEAGKLHEVDHDGPRHELFEHCQELIFELPTNDNWGFKLQFYEANHVMRIEAIKDGSPADRAGMRIGDYIDEVGGDSLHEGGEKQAMRFIRDHKKKQNETVEVVVMRELNDNVKVDKLQKKLQKYQKRGTIS